MHWHHIAILLTSDGGQVCHCRWCHIYFFNSPLLMLFIPLIQSIQVDFLPVLRRHASFTIALTTTSSYVTFRPTRRTQCRTATKKCENFYITPIRAASTVHLISIKPIGTDHETQCNSKIDLLPAERVLRSITADCCISRCLCRVPNQLPVNNLKQKDSIELVLILLYVIVLFDNCIMQNRQQQVELILYS